MNKTLSFVGLDFNLIKPYRNSMLLLLVMGMGMGFGFKSTTTLTSYFMMSLMLILSYPFSIGDKNDLDTLYGTLAISKKNVVVGRYMFVLALEIICASLSLIFSFLLSLVLKIDFVFLEELFTLCLLSCLFSLIVAIQYPIYFKLGYNKAKILALIPLLLLFLIVIELPTLAKLFDLSFSWETLFAKLTANSFLMYVAPVITGLCLIFLSCLVSLKVYKK